MKLPGNAFAFRIIKERVIGLAQCTGHFGKQTNGFVMKGIDRGIDAVHHHSVGLSTVLLFVALYALLRPIDNVAQALTIIMNRTTEIGIVGQGKCRDQTIVLPKRKECFGFEFFVIGAKQAVVTAVQIVIPRQLQRLQAPFCRPSGMEQQMFDRMTGH